MASLTHPLRSARRARWLLTAALVLPLLLFGGAFTWSAPFALGGVALLALLAATVGRRGEARVHPVVLLSAVAWLAVGLQLLPLPRALVALLAPEVLAAKAETWALLQIEPTWVSLTHDPGGTRGAMLTAATVVAGATASSLLARRHGSRTVVLAALTALVLMALVHLVHALVGLDAVYGAYRPRYAAPQPIGPLLNPNHFGALCAFGATLALGLAVDAPERARLGLRLLSGTLALTAALSGSRGALLSLVVAAVTLAALLRSQRGARRLALAVVPAVALVASGALLLPATRARLLDPSTLKLDLAAQSLGLFVEHPIFGVGRGAFSAAFASSATDATRYTHAENIGAQWAAELGLGGVALGLAALAVLVDGARRRRNALDAASVAACVAFVAHELVDFASELSGAALLVVTVAGTLRAGSRPAVHPRWALALALAALASLPLAAMPHYDRARGPEAPDNARRLLVHHPLEPDLLLLEATRLAREGAPEAGRWINRSLRLTPRWAAPHLVAAEWLHVLGRTEQVWLELTEAERKRPASALRTGCRLLDAGASPADALHMSRAGGAEGLDALARCVDRAVARELDALRHARGIATTGLEGRRLRERMASRALQAGTPERAVELLARGDDELLRAEAQLAIGDATAALDALADRDDAPALRVRVRALQALGRRGDRDDALAALRVFASSSPASRAEYLLLEAQIALDDDDPASARRLARQALRAHTSPAARRLLRRAEAALNDRIQGGNGPSRTTTMGSPLEP